MPVTHEPWLVALSLIVAIQGAYVGLSLAVQVAGAVGLRRRLLLAGAAISLAVAIWSMHFVGMLAARLPLPGRLSRLPDAALVPRLRDRGRRRGVRGQRRTVDACPPRRRRLRHGHRHRHHALHRHERAARQRPHEPRAGPGGGERGDRHRRLRRWRSGSPRDAAGGRRSCSRPSRSASQSPACTTPPWPG